MKDTIFYKFYISLKSRLGIAATIIGLFGVAGTFQSDKTVTLKSIAPLIIFLIWLIILLFDTLVEIIHSPKTVLPKVVYASPPPRSVKESVALLIMEPFEIYSHENIVSIFLCTDGYESLLGVGYVFNIQQNGNIQIVSTEDMSDDSSIWEKIRNNDATLLKKIIIKPITRTLSEVMYGTTQ